MNSAYPFYSITQRRAYIEREIKALEEKMTQRRAYIERKIKALEEKMKSERKFAMRSPDVSETFDSSTESNTTEVMSRDDIKLYPSPKYIRLHQNEVGCEQKKKEYFRFENDSLEPNKTINPNAILNQTQRLSDSLSINHTQVGVETILRLRDMGSQGRGRCYKCYADNKLKVGRKYAVVNTNRSRFRCAVCKKNYCLDCFFETHSVYKL